MIMTERLHKLLKILEKRDPTTPGLKERIDRVKSELGAQKPMPAPIPEFPAPKKKTKKLVTTEVEVEE